MLSSIQVPGPRRKRRYGSNQHKGKYTMQLLHSGVILSGLPDYVNRLRHIKRGTGEGGRADGRGERRETNPPRLTKRKLKPECIQMHMACVSKLKRLDDGTYLPRGWEAVEVARVQSLCISLYRNTLGIFCGRRDRRSKTPTEILYENFLHHLEHK
jgi:hypothetical protein